ncbi:MAG: hypothetical protein HYX50_05150 [Chloroflexi bacterium]|nr:hypothetical protein [Chloroflexota bacterium]
MTRNALRIVALGIIITAMAAVAATRGSAPASAAPQPSSGMTVEPALPACDGIQSVRLTFRATPGTLIRIKMLNGGLPAETQQKVTDARGIARFDVTPPAAHDGFFFALATGDQGRPSLQKGPCPLTDSKDYFITGSAFIDRNGDGDREGRERGLPRLTLALNGGCNDISCYLPPNQQNADRLGRFEWDGLMQFFSDPSFMPIYRICLAGDDVRGLRITSINGVLQAPDTCAVVPTLSPGENQVRIGVQRR